jgi:DNA segregation ATPase FtsK/SpoIIIE, S-DNA-T family
VNAQVMVLAVGGLAVTGWVLHRVGHFLKQLAEALAVIAVVFVTAWLVTKALALAVVWVARHWRSTLAVLAVASWWHWLGWPSLVIALAVLGVAALGWRFADFGSFEPWVGRHVRAWRLRWWLYARRMPRWLRACRLTVPDTGAGIQVSVNLLRRSGITRPRKPGRDQTPSILGVRSGPSWDEVRLKLVAGQTPEDYDTAARQLAVARGVARCQVRELAPDVVSVDFQRRNLLTTTVACPGLELFTDIPGTRIDLDRVWAGRTEYGTDWHVSLRGSHTLTAGTTGSGKGTILWTPVRSIAPAIRDGLVRVSGIDPKGMELAYGRRVFHRYAVTAKDALNLLDDLVEGMDARKEVHAGKVRTVAITKDTPLELLEFDEIGALTRYVGDRKTREAITERVALLTTQGRALGYTVRGYVQEPTKDTVPVRELFPRRICLRVASKSHVGMVLGEHAYERGAWANRIGESEPGVGYLFGEGVREPLRVRAGWVSDAQIKQLEQFVTGPTPDTGPGTVLELPTADHQTDGTTGTAEGSAA